MEVSDILYLSIAATLTACLMFCNWKQQQRPTKSHWTGHGIDVTGIAGRVQRVRDDFVAELHARPDDLGYRRGLLASATRAVGRLAYFRRRAAKTWIQKDRQDFLPHS
jgi:hypothetical protein